MGKRLFMLFVTSLGMSCSSPIERPLENVSRTFLQLWVKDCELDGEGWRERFEGAKRLGFDEVILQWTSFGPYELYKMRSTSGAACLTSLLDGATAAKAQIWVGLDYDQEFWNRVKEPPQEVERYLEGRSETAARHLGEVRPLVEEAVAQGLDFRGWYIPDEVDDRSWREPRLRRAFLGYLATYPRIVRATERVTLSGFSNGEEEPEAFGELFLEAASKAGAREAILQDGIGAGKLRLARFEEYAARVARSFRRSNVRLSLLTELFQKAEAPSEVAEGEGRAFSATSFAEAKRRLLAAKRVAAPPYAVFSAFDYLMGDREGAGELGRSWEEELRANKQQDLVGK